MFFVYIYIFISVRLKVTVDYQECQVCLFSISSDLINFSLIKLILSIFRDFHNLFLFFFSRLMFIIYKSSTTRRCQFSPLYTTETMGGKIIFFILMLIIYQCHFHCLYFTFMFILQNEKVLSFMPPDGSYKLLSYHISGG